jgi:hypothetical protein
MNSRSSLDSLSKRPPERPEAFSVSVGLSLPMYTQYLQICFMFSRKNIELVEA